MTSLANLAKVQQELSFLAAVVVVKEKSSIKDCKKFIAYHPEIQQSLDALAINSPSP
jgi:hypothetical protein